MTYADPGKLNPGTLAWILERKRSLGIIKLARCKATVNLELPRHNVLRGPSLEVNADESKAQSWGRERDGSSLGHCGIPGSSQAQRQIPSKTL